LHSISLGDPPCPVCTASVLIAPVYLLLVRVRLHIALSVLVKGKYLGMQEHLISSHGLQSLRLMACNNDNFWAREGKSRVGTGVLCYGP